MANENNRPVNSQSGTMLIPHLTCRNAIEAVDFYQKAFGAEPQMVLRQKNGGLMHACLSINGSMFFLGEECKEYGNLSSLSLGGSPVTLHLQVQDCEAVFKRAVDAGCKVEMPLADMFWGDRYGVISDPFGHKWSIATTVRQVSMEEIESAAAAFSGQ